MKKIITTLTMMSMFAVLIPLLSTSVNAQTRYYRTNRTTYSSTYNRPNFYKRHRNVINVGIGTAAGAGGSALYTYKLNPKTNRYYRVYNR
jgi:hypothetical protein